MHVHYEDLTDVARYIENHAHVTLEDQKATLDNILHNIQRFKKLEPGAKVLEIGVGSGWFQIYCKQQGIDIEGLEISPQLAQVAQGFGDRYNQQLDLKVGNIEETEIGTNRFDCIVAASVFEHVEDWQHGVKKIYDALKPGGVFYFDSTNKFSLTSGEYNFPLYGWMPDRMRYRFRVARQGPDIMKLGIDFHQFRYPLLRRHFKRVGFSKVVDFVDFKDLSRKNLNPLKKGVFRSLKVVRPLKHMALTFAPATIFICVK